MKHIYQTQFLVPSRVKLALYAKVMCCFGYATSTNVILDQFDWSLARIRGALGDVSLPPCVSAPSFLCSPPLTGHNCALCIPIMAHHPRSNIPTVLLSCFSDPNRNVLVPQTYAKKHQVSRDHS